MPHGPAAEGEGAWELCAELAASLRPQLPSNCMFIRFDPPWGIRYPALSKELTGYPGAELAPASRFRKANMDIQPPSTVVLNLKQTEEELLKGMKSKTRYNIRLAAKKGVEVRTAGIEALAEWYELYRITAERDKIALHGYDYYERIFQLSGAGGTGGEAPEFRLLQAVIDGVVEAGIITVWTGRPGGERHATYLYGASSNNKRNYMPAYALQWEAIKQAAAAGCSSYDFFGIPPIDNPDHPMYGLYRFKTGFGERSCTDPAAGTSLTRKQPIRHSAALRRRVITIIKISGRGSSMALKRSVILYPAAFLMNLNLTMINFAVIFFLKDSIGITASVIGWFFAAGSGGYVLGLFAVRPVQNRIKPPVSMFFALVLSVFSILMMIRSESPSAVLLFYFLFSTAPAFYWPQLMGWFFLRTARQAAQYFDIAI